MVTMLERCSAIELFRYQEPVIISYNGILIKCYQIIWLSRSEAIGLLYAIDQKL